MTARICSWWILRLPINGGFSVLQATRANEALAGVPMFVITSSLYDRDNRRELTSSAASAVLVQAALARPKLRDELVRVGAFAAVATAERPGLSALAKINRIRSGL